MKKIGKIVGIAFGGLIALVLVLLCVFWLIQPLLYPVFYERMEGQFTAAGLDDGLVPQGMSYVASEDLFIQCGYMADGKSPSRIYLQKRDGEARYVELLTADSTPYTGHTGGIAVGEKTVWLANDGDGEDNCVWALPLDVLLDPATKDVKLSARFYPEVRSACCYVQNGLLWVGEFYDPAKYPTKESHHLTTPTGENNPSLICAYTIDESQAAGVVEGAPVKALSVREKLQGFAFGPNGEIVLSTSYSIASSHLYVYENVLQSETNATVEIDGAAVPVWYLDAGNLKEDIEMPPMSEEIVTVDGKLYVLFESACHKYIFGILTRGRPVYCMEF